MPEITSNGPVSRHITEYLTTDPRVKQYKCKTLQNPDYFYNGQIFAPVDVAYKLDTSTAKAGGIWLRDKAIVSVGTKKADDAYKLFGMRPDENQGGSESVEWSVESIEINGKPQTINLADRLEVSPITTKFGDNLFVQRARQRCRIMVPGDSETESFKVSLRLHLKGCEVQYRADLDEYWIYRGGVFFCRLGKPYLVDPEAMNPIRGEMDAPYPQLVKHSLVDLGNGEYRYLKEPTEAFEKVELPASYLIDADTVYSSTADGLVGGYNNDWATCRGLATGNNGIYSGYTRSAIAFSAYLYGGATYYIDRAFFYYDLSLLAGTISSVAENLFGYSYKNSDSSSQKGTQSDTLALADFDAQTGISYGNTTWIDTGYNAIAYNATGISDIQTALGSVAKTCVRDNTRDMLNSAPSGATIYGSGLYWADDTSGTKDPYLYITTEAAGPAKAAIAAYYRRLRA
jgi:hypothetical protein